VCQVAVAFCGRKVKRQGGAYLLPVIRSGCRRMEFESPAFRRTIELAVHAAECEWQRARG
jgi:hypothetical protein